MATRNARGRAGVLATGSAMLLLIGLIYAYSILLAPAKAEFGWTVSNMTLVYALSISSFTVGVLASGPFMKSGKGSLALLLSFALLACGFVATVLAPAAVSLPVVCAGYGFAVSFGMGMAYNIVLPTVTAWYPDKPGLAQGVCLMGIGLGGFLLGPPITALYAALPWRLVFALTGAAMAAALLVCRKVITMPGEKDLAPYSSQKARRANVAPAAPDVRPAAMLRDRTFWLLFAFLTLMGVIGNGMTGLGRELPLSLGASEMVAVVVIGLVNVGSGLGRLGTGVLLDRHGRGATMIGIAALMLVAVVGMVLAVWTRSFVLEGAASLLLGAAWGAAVVSMPYVTRTEWGQANMAQNMGIVNSYSIVAALAGSWGAGIISELTGSFVPALLVMVALSAFAIVVACRMAAPRRAGGQPRPTS